MKNELNVDVNVNLTVSKETAERAVIILNMYLQDTATIPVLHKVETPADSRPFWRIDI